MASTTQGASRRTRKQPHLIAFRPKLKIAVHRLPFVGKEHTEDKSFSFWNVPAKGGYMGGCTTGEAIASMYLKHIRESDSDCCAMYLGWMVLDWMERLSSGEIKHGSPEFDALSGQMVGFMSVITKWVGAAVRSLGSNLDNTTNESLLAKANGGMATMQHLRLVNTEEERAAGIEDAEALLFSLSHADSDSGDPTDTTEFRIEESLGAIVGLALTNRDEEFRARLDGYLSIIGPVLERACAPLSAALNQADRVAKITADEQRALEPKFTET